MTADPLGTLRNDDGSIDARNLGTGGPIREPLISRRECYRVRVAVAAGHPVTTHAAASDYSTDAYLAHVRGECQHDTVSHPPLRHGWHRAPDAGIARPDATPTIPVDICRRIRARLAAGAETRDVCDTLDIHHDALRRHARGTCAHDREAVGRAPLRHGWSLVTEDEP